MPLSLNGALALAVAVANIALYWGAPVLARFDQGWLWLAAPAAVLTPTLWALLHEAFHNRLLAGRRANHWAGRGLAVLYGAPFHLLRFGHLLHHARNGEPTDRWDLFDPRQGSAARARAAFYLRLCCGLYLAELLACIPLLGPRRLARRVAARSFEGDADSAAVSERLFAAPAGRALRIDAALVVATMASALVLYGRHWPVLVLALGVRGFLVSLADNALHYGAPTGQRTHAYNTRLATPLAALMLNGNLHGVHHEAPHLPWRDLPRRLAAAKLTPERGYLSCLLQQFRGPVPIGTGEAAPGALRTG